MTIGNMNALTLMTLLLAMVAGTINADQQVRDIMREALRLRSEIYAKTKILLVFVSSDVLRWTHIMRSSSYNGARRSCRPTRLGRPRLSDARRCSLERP